MKFKLRDYIVYEDEYLLVVNKPADLLVIPDRQQTAANLKGIIEAYIKEPIYTVHRLDKLTSGLVVFAKNKIVHQALNQQFQDRKVKKHYYALVNGRVKADSQDITLPLSVKSNISKTFVDLKNGKPSHTALCVKQRFNRYTLLDIQLHTGRMHQIRVHCAAIGHPLAIDPVYGTESSIYMSSFKRNYRLAKGKTERPLMDSLTLHAYKLCFEHPITKKLLTNKVDIPKNFRVLLHKLSDV